MVAEVLQPREHASFSQVVVASRCEEQYRRKYLLGEPDASSLPSVVGTALHSAVERYEESEGEADLLDLAKAELRVVPELENLRYFGKQDATYWFKTGLKRLTDNYLAQRECENFQPILCCELELQVALTDDTQPVKGIIDQVYYDSRKRLVLRDLKSGKFKADNAKQYEMQLQFYALLYEAEYDVRPDYGTLLYLGGPEPRQDVVLFTLDRRTAVEMVRALPRAAPFQHNGAFTGACDWCPYRPSCAVGRVGERNT